MLHVRPSNKHSVNSTVTFERFTEVDSKAVQLQHLSRISLTFPVAAHRKRVLRHLHSRWSTVKLAVFPAVTSGLARSYDRKKTFTASLYKPTMPECR